MAAEGPGDCSGFALRFEEEFARICRVLEIAAQFVHNALHGALTYNCPLDRLLVADSTARELFALEDGERFENKASKPTMWERSGETIMITDVTGRVRNMGPVSQAEAAWRTNKVQWAAKDVVIMFGYLFISSLLARLLMSRSIENGLTMGETSEALFNSKKTGQVTWSETGARKNIWRYHQSRTSSSGTIV